MPRPRATALLLVLVSALGCSPPPRAPALKQGELIYQNKQEGFKFMPPPNWSLHARSELPPGKVDIERILVQYRRVTGAKVASLDVSLIDVPSSRELEAYLVEHGPKRETWQPTGTTEKVDVSGKPGVRGTYKGVGSNDAFLKEVVAVRKGERVYLFNGVYPVGDVKAREQLRKAVESLTWDS